MDDAVYKTRKAILRVFGNQIDQDERTAQQLIERHTKRCDKTGGLRVRIDAGKLGLPLPCEPPALRRWQEVYEIIGHRVEHINSETVAVYGDGPGLRLL